MLRINQTTPLYNSVRLPQKAQKFSNSDAEALLKKELSNRIPETRVDYYMARIKNICENLEIQMKDLPINKEHPGKMDPEKDKELCSALLKVNVLA